MVTDLTQNENTFEVKTEALLTELGRSADRKYRLNRFFRPLSCISSLYFLAHLLCVDLLHLPVPAAYAATVALLYNVALGLMFSWIPEWFLWKRVEKSKARLQMLVNELREDSRAVGALAQLCDSTQLLSVADIAHDPLLKLLPTVKAGDARYISDTQMQALLALLNVRKEEWGTLRPSKELPLAILAALEKIGDSRAIEVVKRLTTGRSNRRYHEAAQKCLAALEQYGEERDYHRFLLLPASPEVARETLLRPTISQVETQPELLLRASQDE